MRIFYAVIPPYEVRNQIYSKISELLFYNQQKIKDISIVPPENLHLTLRFVGEVKEDEKTFNLLKSAALTAASSIFDEPIPLVKISKLGIFPSTEKSPPRILWAGLSSGASSCADDFVANFFSHISSEITKQLDKMRICVNKDSDTKNFIPHITVARIKKSSATLSDIIKKIIASVDALSELSFYPDGIHLVESRLKPSGAEYKSIFHAPFRLK